MKAVPNPKAGCEEKRDGQETAKRGFLDKHEPLLGFRQFQHSEVRDIPYRLSGLSCGAPQGKATDTSLTFLANRPRVWSGRRRWSKANRRACGGDRVGGCGRSKATLWTTALRKKRSRLDGSVNEGSAQFEPL